MQTKRAHILVVDDDEGVLKTLSYSLQDAFSKVSLIKNPEKIPHLLRHETIDLILLDMNFRAGINTGNEGLYWLNEIRKNAPDTAVIMITAYGSINLAVQALKAGATDFITKPWKTPELLTAIRDGLTLNRQKITNPSGPTPLPPLVHVSPVMTSLIGKTKKAAGSDAAILITGESGTGKEVLARHIHAWSDRKKSAFVTIDPGTLPPQLFESELFGHLAGAFTGATTNRTGRIAEADGGTLFLDEIGNLPPALQPKLLTLLQQHSFSPLGSQTPVRVDVRVISATNENLRQLIGGGTFRSDLFFRLNTIELHIPPLRERPSDIGPLTTHFLEHFINKYRKQDLLISEPAMEKLIRYHWPGNIRELQHMIEKAVILSEAPVLKPMDFILREAEVSPYSHSLNLEAVEAATIRKAMEQFPGNLSQVARQLGISRKTLYQKIDKYGL